MILIFLYRINIVREMVSGKKIVSEINKHPPTNQFDNLLFKILTVKIQYTKPPH